MKRRVLQVASLVVIVWGVSQMARGAYIHSKASLAQATRSMRSVLAVLTAMW